MRILTAIAASAILSFGVATSHAQEHREHKGRDPKQMTEKAAQKLNFTEEQNAKLAALNAKYPGSDYDKEKYREDFRTILTDDQKQKMDEMRQQRMNKMKEEKAAE